MWKNNLKIAIRNLVRHKGYSIINILELAAGLAVCLIILLYVKDELSFDRYHEKSDRIYRVTRQWFDYNDRPTLHLARIAPPIGPLLEKDFAVVEESVRFHEEDLLISYKDKHFVEEDIFYAETEVFKMFDWDLVEGDPENALSAPFTCVITEPTAEKYFGSESPLGKILIGENSVDLQVTGVIEDIPRNSHFRFDMLLSYVTLEQLVPPEYMERWNFNNYATYLLLSSDADPDALKSQFPGFIDRRFQAGASDHHQLHLQPLTSIHLFSHLDSELGANGNITYIYIFSGIALLVILIASFNFMNLSLATATRRSKEVGIRKVLGSRRYQLIRQFLGESILLSLIAIIIAFVLVNMFLPLFNTFTGKSLSLFSNGAHMVLMSGIVLTLLVGLLAGIYPALTLSSFKTVTILKGQGHPESSQAALRKILVISQFLISAILIFSMFTVFQQVNYVQTKNLGFNTSKLVVMPLNDEFVQDFEQVKSRVMRHSQISSMTASKYIPSEPLLDNIDIQTHIDGRTVKSDVSINPVEYGFVETFEMAIIAGRDFNERIASDSSGAVLINESTVYQLGWNSPQDAVGKVITLQGSVNFINEPRRIIGVVKDFHFESLRRDIGPLLFIIHPPAFNQTTIRIAGNNIATAMDILEEEWSRYFNNYPFEYKFLDEELNHLYRAEIQLGNLLGYFGSLAIFIAALGLFGLATYAAENRRKEISVRKVVGANILQIVMLLTGDFSRWVIIANLFAWPIGYLLMTKWLHTFAFQAEVNLWIFLITMAITLAIALLTVSYQTVKAAMTNPATVLKYE